MMVMGMKKKSRKDISKRYRGDGLGRVHIADSGMVWKKKHPFYSLNFYYQHSTNAKKWPHWFSSGGLNNRLLRWQHRGEQRWRRTTKVQRWCDLLFSNPTLCRSRAGDILPDIYGESNISDGWIPFFRQFVPQMLLRRKVLVSCFK